MTNPARQTASLVAPARTESLLDAILADMAQETPAPAPKAAPAKAPADDLVASILAMVDVAPPPVAPAKAAPVAPAVKAAPKAAPAPVVDDRPVAGRWQSVNGVWCVKAPAGKPGDRCKVTRKDGRTATVTLGREVRPGVFEKEGPQTQVRRQCPGDNSCRVYGWKQGPNCSPM